MIWRLMAIWLGRRTREIFRFWDGRRWRYADPLAVARALENNERFDWTTHPALTATGDLDALKVTADAVREAFALPLFDGRHGLTEGECLSLLADFTDYLDSLKKNTSPSPMWPVSTASDDPSPTKSSSDSGSTVTEATPEPLPESGTASG